MKLNLFVIACRQITTSSTRSATAVAPGGGWLFPTRPWSALDYLIPWEGRNAVCCDFSFYRLLLLFCAMYISRAVTVVLSFPELSFPSSPAFCLLEMWSRDCCAVYPWKALSAGGTLSCWFTDKAHLWQHPLKSCACLSWAALLSSSAALQSFTAVLAKMVTTSAQTVLALCPHSHYFHYLANS